MSWLDKFIVDPRGQWAHPGKPTMIPNTNGKITMRGVPYPVLGIDDQGNAIQMMPGGQYQFPGNNVYEIPMIQMGGDPSIPNLSDRGWLQKYQDGGVKSFGSKYEYVEEGDSFKIRQKGTSDWRNLDADRTRVFKAVLDRINNIGQEEELDYVDQWLSSLNQPKPAKPVSKPQAKTPKGPKDNFVESPLSAEITPSLYTQTSGVNIPAAEQIATKREVNKYATSPEFRTIPYKDEETAITEYKQSPDYNLRYKNINDYTPEDITKVQSYLDSKGYYPSTKPLINKDDYKTPEEITELQKFLIKEGLIDVLGINGETKTTSLSGKLDKNTLAAIEQYNMHNKKYKDGELDNSTKDAIRTYKNKTDAKNVLGLNISDPFELYDPKTGDPNVELTNKSMQDFEQQLIDKGFFTGNVKYDISSKAIENPRVAFKFTLNDDMKTPFGHCAQYVNGTVCKEDVVGEEAREELGFKGSAWQISENLQDKGGSLIFAGLPEREKVKLTSADEITTFAKELLSSPEIKQNLQVKIGSGNLYSEYNKPEIKPGDVVNIFYEGSAYTKEAYNQTEPLKNRFFTTHVGIVKADDNGDLYVEHNIHGKIEKDPIQKFVDGKVKGNGKDKVSLIAGITRPNYFDGVDNDGRIPAAGISYYQTEYGQFNPEGALANKEDWAAKSVSGEQTYKFLSTIEKNKDAILKDIPITENEFGKLMRVARLIPTLETYSGKNYEEPGVIRKSLQDALISDREKSMGITMLKDETNLNEALRNKLYESDYDLADPVKAGLPTFYVLSKNYLYLKEALNQYGLDLDTDELAKLAGLAYNQSIGKIAAEVIEKGGFKNYIDYRKNKATKGNGDYAYRKVVDLYDKQTRKKGGAISKNQYINNVTLSNTSSWLDKYK